MFEALRPARSQMVASAIAAIFFFLIAPAEARATDLQKTLNSLRRLSGHVNQPTPTVPSQAGHESQPASKTQEGLQWGKVEKRLVRGSEVPFESTSGCSPDDGLAVIHARLPSQEVAGDDAYARDVMEAGKQLFLERCPSSRSKLRVELSVGGMDNGHGDYSPEDGHKAMSNYRNVAAQYVAVQRQRQEQERHAALAEAERQKARAQRWSEFASKYGVHGLTSIDPVRVNPFIYEGKTVAIHTFFRRMVSRDAAEFGSMMSPSFTVSGVSPNQFTSADRPTILAIKVMGMKDQVPDLKFLGVHFCEDNACSDMLPAK